MVEAWNLQANPNAAILFVIEDVTINICDQVMSAHLNRSKLKDFNISAPFQRFHEFYIRETHPEIKVIRKTLTEIHQQAKLGPNNELIM